MYTTAYLKAENSVFNEDFSPLISGKLYLGQLAVKWLIKLRKSEAENVNRDIGCNQKTEYTCKLKISGLGVGIKCFIVNPNFFWVSGTVDNDVNDGIMNYDKILMYELFFGLSK